MANEAKQGSYMFGSKRKGAKQWQEDSFGTWESPSKTVSVMCVYDGHGGYNGLVASNVATEQTLAFFTQHQDTCQSWTSEEWQKHLIDMFTMIHSKIRARFIADGSKQDPRVADEKGIVRNGNGDPIHGGSTGSVVALVRHEDKSCTIHHANVGDSTALLIPRKRNSKEYSFLSVDHGPENPTEYKRIHALPSAKYPTKLLFVYDKANVYRKYECPLVFTPEGEIDQKLAKNPWKNGLHPTNVRYEPAVYAVTPRSISKDTTCIAMTRALGDFYAQQFGLTFVPDVASVEIPVAENDFTLLVASDGIWDCWKYEDLALYINKKLDQNVEITPLVEHSLNESIQRAIANFGAKHYDDASLILYRRQLE